jgi:hypothetical protein
LTLTMINLDILIQMAALETRPARVLSVILCLPTKWMSLCISSDPNATKEES